MAAAAGIQPACGVMLAFAGLLPGSPAATCTMAPDSALHNSPLPRPLFRFHIMGGECNYLLRVAGPDKRLQFVPDTEWKSPFMQVRRPRGAPGTGQVAVSQRGCASAHQKLAQLPMATLLPLAMHITKRRCSRQLSCWPCHAPAISRHLQSWTEAQCQRLLDDAERLLLEGAHRLRLPVQVGAVG